MPSIKLDIFQSTNVRGAPSMGNNVILVADNKPVFPNVVDVGSFWEARVYIAKEAAHVISQPPSNGIRIPYRSQWDVDANNRASDCGMACVAMVAESKGVKVPINSILPASPQGWSTGRELASALRGLGLPAVESSSDKPGSIVLVKYGELPDRMDTFSGLHWMVILEKTASGVIVHDPDWWGSRRNEGENKWYPLAAWNTAFQGSAVSLT